VDGFRDVADAKKDRVTLVVEVFRKDFGVFPVSHQSRAFQGMGLWAQTQAEATSKYLLLDFYCVMMVDCQIDLDWRMALIQLQENLTRTVSRYFLNLRTIWSEVVPLRHAALRYLLMVWVDVHMGSLDSTLRELRADEYPGIWG